MGPEREIEISDELNEKVDVYLQEKNMTFEQLVNKAVEWYLNQISNKHG